jgi:hypothetical protein
VLLSHADRTRIMPAGRTIPLRPGNGAAMGTLLVDGFYRADWRIVRDGDAATLNVEPYERLSKADAAAVTAEAERLLDFAAGDAVVREVTPL